MSEQYVIYSAQERRGGSDRPQYLAMDGQAVFWSPKQKQAQRLSYKQAMRIRRRKSVHGTRGFHALKQMQALDPVNATASVSRAGAILKGKQNE